MEFISPSVSSSLAWPREGSGEAPVPAAARLGAAPTSSATERTNGNGPGRAGPARPQAGPLGTVRRTDPTPPPPQGTDNKIKTLQR